MSVRPMVRIKYFTIEILLYGPYLTIRLKSLETIILFTNILVSD